MQFFRNNAFYTILIVAVVGIGVPGLWFWSSLGDKVTDALTPREAVLDKLAGLTRGEPVNDDTKRARQEYVDDVRAMAETIDKEAIAWNSRNYSVLQLPISDGDDNEIGRQAAFPIDHSVYKTRQLRWVYTTEYRLWIENELKRIGAIDSPSPEEIQRATAIAQEKIRTREMREAHKREAGGDEDDPATPVRKRNGVGNVPFDGGGMDGMPMGPMGMAPRVGRKAPAGAQGNIGDEATRRGFLSAKLANAQKGRLYANIESLDVVFRNPDASAPDERLWQAEVNRWITSDILSAIDKTIKDTARGGGKRGVAGSSIKHLEAMEIVDGYIVPGGVTMGVSLKAEGVKGVGGKRGGQFASPDSMEDYMRPDFGAAGVGMKPRTSSKDNTGKPQATKGYDNLTERVTNSVNDVKHYSFTVVMDIRYLEVLERNLMGRNLHTILRISAEAVLPDENSPYYYGSDPVMRVTIEGELLLLTQWHRGTKGSEEFPPIMPKLVLKQIEHKAPTALRGADKERLGKSAAKKTKSRFPRR